jgi:hypothetical protein
MCFNRNRLGSSWISGMKPRLFLLFLMAALFTGATVVQNGASPGSAARKPVRVLLVVAHPDDEYEVAGTVYRTSKELLGTVDQVIITDGEAGYRYSSLAAPWRLPTTGSN